MLDAHPGEQFVMVHADIRHFRLYNTFFGENAGDKLLCDAADMFRWMDEDYEYWVYGRITADVFCAFLPYDKERYNRHVAKAMKMLKEYRSDFMVEPVLGLYFVTDPQMPIETMFTRAALAAKSVQQNTPYATVIYNETLERKLIEEQMVTRDMQTAVDKEQFEVFLQPKYSLKTNKPVGAEALVRWNHPEKGYISPGVFIPVFENNGFITTLDRYMWEKVCGLLSKWKKEGRPLAPIYVNVSRLSMFSKSIVDFLKELVEKYDIEPKYLELELTESAYMDNPEDLKITMKELQEYGFRILIDDFGSGYSSLNTLRELPVDILKLDMKFLADSQSDPRTNAVLSSVVRMSKLLNLPIVAEGVEKQEQADYLRGIGCEYAQGYLFARPMPVEEYEKLLEGAGIAEATMSESDIAGTAVSEEELDSHEITSHAQYSANAAEMVKAIDNTGIRMFMYFPQTKTITVPEKTCVAYQCSPFYDNMPHSFADDYVHQDDYPAFKEMYYKIDRGEKTADAMFHSKDFKYCNHVTLTTESWTEDGHPKDVFGLIEDRTDVFRNEQFIKNLQDELSESVESEEMDNILKDVAVAIGSQYYAVYYIWLESHKFVCMEEKLPGVLGMIGEAGEYESAWGKYIKGFIKENDRSEMWKFVDINTLAERLEGKSSIACNYRRKGVGWTRGKFIPGKRDENGKLLTVIYTVVDINAEMENYKKRTQAEMEALRDPLTGLWNRKAFEQYKNNEAYKGRPTGLMVFDIDRFKEVNDRHGHDVGDQVIKIVCNQVRNSLRRDDLVFRMGGDEFAVLLYNCKEGIWNSICRKISQIHADVKEILPKELNITISAGLCVHEEGYSEDIFNLADRALYHTKINGRGGCTMIDLDGTIMQEWHDASTVLRKGDALERNSTVTWRAEIPKDTKKPVRAYGDELFMSFVGITHQLTPEETYRAWLSRVQPDYLDIIRAAIKAAIKEGNSEVVYRWNHPEKGVVQLRCSASFDSETPECYALIGYIHITSGMHVYTLEDVSDRVRGALEELYFCNFYVRLNDYSFKIYKAQPYAAEMVAKCSNAIEAINAYVNYIEDKEERDKISEFLDLTTIRQRLSDKNVVSEVYSDANMGRMRARFIVVDRDAQGVAETVTLIMKAI